VVSIRVIVTAAMLVLLSAAVVSVGTVQERNARRALTAEIQKRLLLEARNLALAAGGAFLNDFPELTLLPLVKELQEGRQELALAVVTDRDGVIEGHRDSRVLGTPYRAPENLRPAATTVVLAEGESLLENSELLVARAPVRHPNGSFMGRATVGIRRDYLATILARARRRQMIVTAVVLGLGLAAALVLLSVLLRPVGVLRAGLERIGRGDLDTPVALRDRTEFGMLADTVNAMAKRVKQAQHDLVEKERLTHEMDLARDIQSSLLPSSRIEMDDFVIQGSHRAAFEVGGDFYDVFRRDDGTVGLAVADVAGKGLAGCLVMSMLSAWLRAERDRHGSPSELLAALDERLGESLRRGSFVTMFYGILEPATGRLRFASAGHSPTMIYRAVGGTVERIESDGIPLGAIRGGAIRRTLIDRETLLGPGDLLVQYTDGINESFDPAGREQFGFERMETAIRGAAESGCLGVLDGLRHDLEAWQREGERLDDETILVAGRRAPAGRKADPETADVSALEDEDPAGWLKTARAIGDRLLIPADSGRLGEVRGWLGSRTRLHEIDGDGMNRLSTAIYEACANITEHGYGEDPTEVMEVWWCPSGDGGAGYFLVRDQGKPFTADNWVASDFEDPKVWRRGRGFGLDIIHRVMSQVLYRPGTPDGNLTLMRFEPAIADDPGAKSHA